MKKNSFLGGAVISTLGIVITKAIGLLYVIPFYAIIGTQGGALYSYAYSIYAIFLSLSNSGIPVAISKVVSEYNALGYHYTKEKAYKIASLVLIGLGVFFCLVLMIFAPVIAKIILGDIQGGNTVEGVTLVIRIVATALLIVPIESVTQGYLQGQKFMLEPSMANVIEQIGRVAVILIGSYLMLDVFHLSLESAVGVAVFGATVGALIAYFYLLQRIHKNRKKLHRDEKPLEAENLKCYNEYGGFSKDGSEYLIRVNKDERLPTVWSNIMANEKLGTVVTEGLGGYTWYKNSRLRKNNCME